MRYRDYNRGTKTGRTYRYAGCEIWWNGCEWIANAPNSNIRIASAKGIKPMRDTLHKMKMEKEGPWA